MIERIKTAIIILLLLLLVGFGYWQLSRNPEIIDQLLVEVGLTTPEPEGLTASGYIEATEILIAPKVGGKIVEMGIGESDSVTEDQFLVQIDTALIDAKIAEAEAAVEMAQANLELVQAGAQAEEIAVAEAAVDVAEANRQAAYQAWQDALRQRDNPQERRLQAAGAQTELTKTEQQIRQRAELKDAAELMDRLRERQTKRIEEGYDFYLEIPPIPGFSEEDLPDNIDLLEDPEPGERVKAHYEFREGKKRQAWATWNMATTDLWKAWVNLNRTVEAYEAAQQRLANLKTLVENPQQRQLQVARTEADYRRTEAAIAAAEANLALTRAGATPEQVEIARSEVREAQAALEQLQIRREDYSLYAPSAGVVLELPALQGEIIQPGIPLLTIGNLGSLELVIYVPERDVSQVSLGQTAQVTVDTFPDETFTGEVVWIADEAEYTPSNVQTAEERANLVFAVKIQLPNPDRKLKAGMPADVVLEPEEGTTPTEGGL